MSNMWTFTFVLVAIIAEVYSRDIPDFGSTQRLQVEKGQYMEIRLGLWIHRDSPGAPCADEEYLEIRDGYNQSGNLLGVFCGRYVPHFTLRSNGQNTWLRFSSNHRYRLFYPRYYEGKALSATVPTNLRNVAKTQFVLHQSSSLWCPAEGGPAPRIVWRKNGAVVQNSTSVRLQINVTEEERSTTYSCEVDDHGQLKRKNINLIVEKCPQQCQCKVLKGNMRSLVSADCGTKQLKLIPKKIPRATGKLTLSNNKLKHLPKEVFSRNSNLLKLDLSKNKLQKLPAGAFSNNSRLEHLILSNNQLQNLTQGVFAGIKVSLRGMLTLDLSHNQLKNLSPEVFGGIYWSFSSTVTLDLSHNQLQDLPSEIFRELSGLVRLDLSHNQLQDLPPKVFSHLFYLDRVDLSYNQLEQLPPRAFFEMVFLQELYLNNNNLKYLSSDQLPKRQHWPIFENLTLDFNKLKTLPSDIFQRFKIIDLWLGNNNIKELPENLFAGQDKLKYLRLSGNQLEKLSREIFLELSALEELDLSYNQLQFLPRGILSNNTNLTELNLSNNKIQRLPMDIFGNLTQMKRLFLSSNKLQRLPRFTNLSKLEILYMDNNSLVHLSPDQFQGLSKLEELAVYENNIKHLPREVFKGMKNMMSMNFYFNNIRAITNEHLKDVAPTIRFLYFHFNEMRELPEGFFSNMKNLITATVDTNLMCCHLTKEDADCDFAYVDSFASCETLFRNRAPRECLWVIGIMSLVGAVFVIVWRLVFREKKKKNKIQSMMLIHLAGADGLMGVYLITIGVVDAIWAGEYYLHDYYWRSSLTCQITGAIAVMSSEVSVMTICLLSADRMKNVLFPYRGKSLSLKVTHLLCFLIWIVGGIIAFIPTVGFDYFGSRQKGHHFYGRSVVCLPLQLSTDKPSGWEYSVAMFVGLNFILVLFVVVAYTMIIYKTCASSRRMAKQGTERERRMKAKARAAHLRREASLAKRVFFIVLTDCACWLPIVAIGMRSLLEKSFRTPGDLAVWIAVFVLPVNSAINPILYTLSTPQVRGVIRAKLQPLWDYLMTKLGRNQNAEVQDQGIEMRVIEEVQNQEEVESADDSEDESQEEQGDGEQHAGSGEDNEQPTESQQVDHEQDEEPKQAKEESTEAKQVECEENEEQKQGRKEPTEQQRVERKQDEEPKQGQEEATELQQVVREQDEEPKQCQEEATEQQQVVREQDEEPKQCQKEPAEQQQDESKRNEAPKDDHEEPPKKHEVEQDHQADSKGNKEVSETQREKQELNEDDGKPERKLKGYDQESKQPGTQEEEEEKEPNVDHAEPDELKDEGKQKKKSKRNEKESEQQQEQNKQDEQEQEEHPEETEKEQVDCDQEEREQDHKDPKLEQIGQEKPKGDDEDSKKKQLDYEQPKEGHEEHMKDQLQQGKPKGENQEPKQEQLETEKPKGEYEKLNQNQLGDEKSKEACGDSQPQGDGSSEDKSPRQQQLVMDEGHYEEDDMVLDTRL
nr:leucine-rich repeat-containing G-protein coupled receptor 5-like isoform X5 [Pocillopora verrucosa]